MITNRHVITAAHCVVLDEEGTFDVSSVRLGEWNLNTNPDCNEGICADKVADIPVQRKLVHELYDPKNYNSHNDIALLFLAMRITITDWIQPICLPLTPELLTRSFTSGNDYFAVGWGQTETGICHSFMSCVSAIPL